MPSPDIRDFPTDQELDEGLEVNFQLVIPSTRDGDVTIKESAFQDRIETAVGFLTNTFGGVTYDVQTGTYQFEGTTRVVEERVAVINVYADSDAWNRHDIKVKRWIADRKKNWGQESMGFGWEGDFIFV